MNLPFSVPVEAFKDLDGAVEFVGYGQASFLAMVKYGAVAFELHDLKPMFKVTDLINLKLDIIKRSNEVIR